MSDNVRRDNRRALPKYLLTILLFGLLGGVLGFFTGVAGAAGVAETVRQALDRVLAVCAPWGHRRQRRGAAGGGLVPLCRRQTALCRLGWGGRGRHGRGGAAAELGSAADGAGDNLDFFFFAASHHLRPPFCRT